MVTGHSGEGARSRVQGAFLVVLGVAAMLATLPNFCAAVWPAPDVGHAIRCLHGLALFLLPAAILPFATRKVLLAWLPAVVLAPACTAYLLITKHPPTEWAVLLALETNSRELSNFASAGLPVLLLTPLLAVGYVLILQKGLQKQWQPSLLIRLVIVAAALALPLRDLVSGGESLGWSRSADRFLVTYPSGTMVCIAKAVGMHWATSERRGIETTLRVEAATNNPAREIHVLVIGESARYLSFQTRSTSPQLADIRDLLRFSDVAAPGTCTIQSVPVLLTPVTAQRAREAYSAPSVIMAFRKAGYRTYWISMQRKFGLWDTASSRFADDADESVFASGKLTVDPSQYQTGFDTELVAQLQRVLARREPKVFLVLHTVGSHGAYADRYPEAFNRFNADAALCRRAARAVQFSEEQKEQLSKAYDNSILFTDHVLAELIAVLREAGCPATMTYIADHGENTAYAPVLPCNHGTKTVDVLHVPMFVWLSTPYRQAWPRKSFQLEAAQSKPTSGDCIFDTLMDMAGLRTSVTDLTRSLAHESYRPHTRWALTLNAELIDVDKDVFGKVADQPQNAVTHRAELGTQRSIPE